ncbi:MAG: sterol desaturase family protein [Calothrix sp. MO_167.B42]|nr:sterol desaturase family protein [Calothrix sp. MO_167.B42]
MYLSHLDKWFRPVLKAVFPLCTLLLLFEIANRFSREVTNLLSYLDFPFGTQELLSTIIIFVIINIPLILAEYFSPGRLCRRNYLQGAKYWLIYIVITYYWSKGAAVIIAKLQISPFFTWSIENHPDDIVGIKAIFIGILLPILVFDFFYYWFHRAQHRFAFLWYFHKIHHSIVNMNCINSYHHVLEEVLRFPCIIIPMTFLLKIDAPQMTILSAFVATWGQYIHSDTSIHFGKLSAVFADNAYHRIHHSILERHFDKNFAGFFPVWDQLFGTHHKIEHGRLPDVGLADILPPKSVFDYLLMSFQGTRNNGC